MKRITALLLLMLICFGFTSCNDAEPVVPAQDGSQESQKELVCRLLEKECEDSVIYGICLFCGENIDPDTYICDSCEGTKNCLACEAELKLFDYIFCTECYGKMEQGGEIPVYDASLESTPNHGNSQDEPNGEDSSVFCENCRAYLSEDEKLYCDSCWYSDECYYCGVSLSKDEYVVCGECAQKTHSYCQNCGISLKNDEEIYCSDCE